MTKFNDTFQPATLILWTIYLPTGGILGADCGQKIQKFHGKMYLLTLLLVLHRNITRSTKLYTVIFKDKQMGKDMQMGIFPLNIYGKSVFLLDDSTQTQIKKVCKRRNHVQRNVKQPNQHT